MLLDSIEHVPDPRRFIERAAYYTAEGGYLVVDTRPLYYSSVGHHLYPYFPPETWPWVHLRADFPEMLRARGIDAWSMERFVELNKVTHDEIRGFLEQSGLTITFEHRDVESPADRGKLESLRGELVLEGIPEHRLFETWIMIVARRL